MFACKACAVYAEQVSRLERVHAQQVASLEQLLQRSLQLVAEGRGSSAFTPVVPDAPVDPVKEQAMQAFYADVLGEVHEHHVVDGTNG